MEDILKQHSLFFKDIFLSYGTKRSLEKNAYLLERGSPANELWYIAEGMVRTFCTGYDGEEVTIFYIPKNSIVYLESLIPGSTIIQDAQAAARWFSTASIIVAKNLLEISGTMKPMVFFFPVRKLRAEASGV